MIRTRYARRRTYRRKAPAKTRRRYTVRKRTYRKKASRPTRKSILNVTSRKKRDTMMSVTNTTASGTSQSPLAPGPLIVTGAVGSLTLWNATARDLFTANNYNTIADQAARTSTICFMRGLSENLRIQTSSGLPWFWRRICFTFRGQYFNTSTSPLNPETYYTDTSNGIGRTWLNLNINNSSTALGTIQSIVFKGTQGKDWEDYLTAPVDNSRVTLKYDKTTTFRSGNANGIVSEKKLWHKMNHNLVYDDDENGDSEITKYVSVNSKAGMGDYYIMDIILPGTGGTSTDYFQLRSTSTLYWHEK